MMIIVVKIDSSSSKSSAKGRQAFVDESFCCWNCQFWQNNHNNYQNNQHNDFFDFLALLASILAGKSGCSPYKNLENYRKNKISPTFGGPLGGPQGAKIRPPGPFSGRRGSIFVNFDKKNDYDN